MTRRHVLQAAAVPGVLRPVIGPDPTPGTTLYNLGLGEDDWDAWDSQSQNTEQTKQSNHLFSSAGMTSPADVGDSGFVFDIGVVDLDDYATLTVDWSSTHVSGSGTQAAAGIGTGNFDGGGGYTGSETFGAGFSRREDTIDIDPDGVSDNRVAVSARNTADTSEVEIRVYRVWLEE